MAQNIVLWPGQVSNSLVQNTITSSCNEVLSVVSKDLDSGGNGLSGTTSGLTIRPAVADDAAPIAKVHVDSWRTTYKGIVPDDYLNGLSYERSQKRWLERFQQGGGGLSTYVAQDQAGDVVGFACGSDNREDDADYTGELQAIYLLASSQGQGIGHMLVRAVAQALNQRGHRSMVVWVLAANPACGFYEAIGGQSVRQKTIRIGGVDLNEVQYGWKDVSVLLK